MFSSLFNKAESTAHEIAKDAGITLFVIILQFTAVLFILSGAAWGLSYVVAPPIALLITGLTIGATAGLIILVRRNGDSSQAQERNETRPASTADTFERLTSRMGSLTQTLDIVAAGMFTRQLKRAPVATFVATAAAGLLMGYLAQEAAEDDDS